jgi:hypothetical protein
MRSMTVPDLTVVAQTSADEPSQLSGISRTIVEMFVPRKKSMPSNVVGPV